MHKSKVIKYILLLVFSNYVPFLAEIKRFLCMYLLYDSQANTTRVAPSIQGRFYT